MKNYLILLFAILLPISVAAQDHLEPEDSVFSFPQDDNYHAIIVNAFEELYGHGVVARAIVIPSFQPEYGVGLIAHEDRNKIIHLEPEIQLWQFKALEYYKAGEIQSRTTDGESQTDKDIAELEKRLPNSIEGVTFQKCEIAISSELSKLLRTVWRKMLLRTRYSDKGRIGLDGVTYHFSSTVGLRVIAGKTWSPEENSSAGRFTDISDLMRQSCKSGDKKILMHIKTKAEELLSTLEIGPLN